MSELVRAEVFETMKQYLEFKKKRGKVVMYISEDCIPMLDKSSLPPSLPPSFPPLLPCSLPPSFPPPFLPPSPFLQHLLSTYYMPSAGLGAEAAEIKTCPDMTA